MKICAITNVFNESFNLPIWIRHYTQQLGPNACFVLDHGSDDGSTLSLGGDVSVLRYPRSLFNDGKRSMMITDIARGLLREFDLVIYTDSDELLVADPRQYKNLRDFFENDVRDTYTAFGLNVVQHINFEDAFDPRYSIFSQRRYAHFVAPMCKTSATRRAIRWSGGFHSASVPPAFGGLYLFHMRWMDLAENLRRLRITRGVEWQRKDHATYQKAEITKVLDHFQKTAEWSVDEDNSFLFQEEKEMLLAGLRVENDMHRMPSNVRPRVLLKLPDWFPDNLI
jgi:hypothetical protein